MIPAKIEQFLKGMNEPDFLDRKHLDACMRIHDLVREYVENGTGTIEVEINVDLLMKAEKVLWGLDWTVEEALVLYLLWCIVCPEQMKSWYEKVEDGDENEKNPHAVQA